MTDLGVACIGCIGGGECYVGHDSDGVFVAAREPFWLRSFQLTPAAACRLAAVLVEQADASDALARARRHQKHYRSCGCLGDSAECCDPTCCDEGGPVTEAARGHGRLREALELIDRHGCTSFHGGFRCLDPTSGRTRRGRYEAEAWCDACIANDALSALRGPTEGDQ